MPVLALPQHSFSWWIRCTSTSRCSVDCRANVAHFKMCVINTCPQWMQKHRQCFIIRTELMGFVWMQILTKLSKTVWAPFDRLRVTDGIVRWTDTWSRSLPPASATQTRFVRSKNHVKRAVNTCNGFNCHLHSFNWQFIRDKLSALVDRTTNTKWY